VADTHGVVIDDGAVLSMAQMAYVIGMGSKIALPLQVDATKYDRSKAVMVKRIYPVHSHVKYGYR